MINFIKSVKHRWRMLLIGYYFMKLVKVPYGNFAGIGQLSAVITDAYKLKLVTDFLLRHPQARTAFEERPRLGKVDLQQLHQLPENTLGYLYANHMLKNGLTAPQAPETADASSFARVHILETHDIWHVVTGCDTTKAGEIKLEAFYVAQIYPSALFLALLAKNLLKTAIEDIELCEQHMDALAQGWLLGKQAKPLFGINWNSLWEVPLEQLRTQLHLNRPLSEVVVVEQVA